MPALTHNRVKNGFNGGIRKRNATQGTVNRRISGMGKVDGLRSKALVGGIGSTPEHIRRAYNRRVRCSCKTQSPSEVEITGSFISGETLGVTLINFNDVGKSPNIAYQWTRNNLDITGETNDSYTILSSDFNKTISVKVTYINIYKVTRIIKANNPTIVASPAGTQTGSVTITATGGYKVGQTLTANTSTITDTNVTGAISFTYQWTRDGTNISGATSQNYLQVSADSGKVINVKAIYTNDYSTQVTVTSTNTTQTIQNTIASVAITGNFKEGQTLQAVITDNDTFDESKVTFTWKNNDPTPATLYTGTGSTYKNYTIASGDVGKIINVTVVYVDNNGFSENVTSTNTLVVNTVGTIAFTSSTGQFKQGAILTSAITEPNGAPSSVSYQWKRNGTNITGANSQTYTVVLADVGNAITVNAQYTDALGFTEDITSSPETILDSDGVATLSGDFKVGRTLTATISDDNGINPGTQTYQWIKGSTNITGETSSTYVVRSGDEGATINCKVGYTDSAGNVTANLASTNTTVIPTTTYGTNKTFTVTVISDPVSTLNKFVLDGNSSLPNLYIKRGVTYTFDQSDNSNATHNMEFSSTNPATTTTKITAGVLITGAAGTNRSYQFTPDSTIPDIIYMYCEAHGVGMGSYYNPIYVVD